MSRRIRKIVATNFNGDYGKAISDVRSIERDLRMEQAKRLLRENGGKIPYHRWYRNEQYNYSAYGLLKGKVTGYFKSYSVGRGGARRGTIYYKCHEIGLIVYIDEAMGKIGIRQGMANPRDFQASNKKEYDGAFKRLMKMIN